MGTNTKPAGRLPSALLMGCPPNIPQVLPDFRHNPAPGTNCSERDISARKAGHTATGQESARVLPNSPRNFPPSALLPPSWRDREVVMAGSSFLCPLIIYPSPKLHPTHMHSTGLHGKFYCQATLASYWAELALVNDLVPSILSTWDPAASTALAQVTKAPALSPMFQRVPLWPVSCCISLHESGVHQVGSVSGSLVSTPN